MGRMGKRRGGELVGMGRRKNKQMLSSVANERYSSGTFLPTHIHIHTHTHYKYIYHDAIVCYTYTHIHYVHVHTPSPTPKDTPLPSPPKTHPFPHPKDTPFPHPQRHALPPPPKTHPFPHPQTHPFPPPPYTHIHVPSHAQRHGLQGYFSGTPVLSPKRTRKRSSLSHTWTRKREMGLGRRKRTNEQGIPLHVWLQLTPVNPGVIVRHCGHTHNAIEGIGGEGEAKTVLLRV